MIFLKYVQIYVYSELGSGFQYKTNNTWTAIILIVITAR